MNKTRIILASTGGVIGVGVLASAFFLWNAFSKKTAAFEGDEESDGLETVVSQLATLMNKKPYPDAANEKQLQANRQAFEEWTRSVRAVAAEGDWLADGDCTPAQFKEIIGRDAKALSDPTKKDPAAIVAPDFAFGPFKDYLADKMPARDELPRLQREWYDITSLIRLLATNGVIRLTDVQVVERKEPEVDAKAKAKMKMKAKTKARAANEEPEPSVETYRLAFQARPEALVGVVRDLSFQRRFTVVDSFGFTRERDAIAHAFGMGEKKEAAAASGGRRRRRPSAAESEKPVEKSSSGVVFDPETDATLNVELTVSVYDFRTLEDGDEKGASK